MFAHVRAVKDLGKFADFRVLPGHVRCNVGNALSILVGFFFGLKQNYMDET